MLNVEQSFGRRVGVVKIGHHGIKIAATGKAEKMKRKESEDGGFAAYLDISKPTAFGGAMTQRDGHSQMLVFHHVTPISLGGRRT